MRLGAGASSIVERRGGVALCEMAKQRVLSLDLLRGLIMIIMAWDHARDYLSDQALPRQHGSEMWSGLLATYDNDFMLFFQRWIAHICAPGFFYLMGVGMGLFALSREKQGWSAWRIFKHFAFRGSLLLLFDRIVNTPVLVEFIRASSWRGAYNPFPNNDYRHWTFAFIGIFEVLTSLGLSMIVCGALVPLFLYLGRKFTPNRHNGALRIANFDAGELFALLLCVGSFALSNGLVVHYQDGNPTLDTPWPRASSTADSFGKVLVRFLVLPGKFYFGMIAYAMIPWIGICLAGIATSRGYNSQSLTFAHGRNFFYASLCLVLFLIIRGGGGSFGNYRGWPRGEAKEDTFLIAFFDVCKYPPSPAYALITGTVNFFFLSGLGYFADKFQWDEEQQLWDKETQRQARTRQVSRSGGEASRPLTENLNAPIAIREDEEINASPPRQLRQNFFSRWAVRVLLTFGRVPLFYYVLQWEFLALTALILHLIFSSFHGLPIWWVSVPWILVVTILYPLCARYSTFKNSTHPDSIWRFL